MPDDLISRELRHWRNEPRTDCLTLSIMALIFVAGLFAVWSV